MGKLVLVACTNVGRAIIEEIMNNKNIKTELVGVVNLNTEQGMVKANYDPYTDLAMKYQLDIHYCHQINDPDTLAFIASKKPDVILQSGWSQKFGDALLAIPKYACIGEHPAPLPKGRGAACVNWAILTGETAWGDSFFRMVSEYDKGELFAQKFFDIAEYDTVYTVYEKVAHAAAQTVAVHLDHWSEGRFNAISQDDTKATYYKRRRPQDGEIKSFNRPANELHNFIRAQTKPYPGAYIISGGKKTLLLLSTVPARRFDGFLPGTVADITKNGGILLVCKDGEAIELLRVQEEGHPEHWACDWARENDLLCRMIILQENIMS